MKIDEKSQKSKIDNVAFSTVTEDEKANERTISSDDVNKILRMCCLLSMLSPNNPCKCESIELIDHFEEKYKGDENE